MNDRLLKAFLKRFVRLKFYCRSWADPEGGGGGGG